MLQSETKFDVSAFLTVKNSEETSLGGFFLVLWTDAYNNYFIEKNRDLSQL